MSGPNPLRTLLALRRHRGASSESIRVFRERHLRRLVRHAYDRVPYYHRLFDSARIAPADIRTAADLRDVPVTTRAMIQELPPEEIVARGIDPEKLMRSASAGSTGEPVTVRRTWLESRLLATLRVRGFKELGLRRDDRVVTVKTLSTENRPDQTLVGRALGTLRRAQWGVVDSSQSSAAILSQLGALGTTVLGGYPAHLSVIASDVGPERARSLGLRFVVSGGEVLTSDQREQIEETFGVPLRDTYASIEFDLLASECPSGFGYHVSDDGLVLDVVRDGVTVSDGEQGEVVGTCLHSYAMPFIRYAQGDVVCRGEDQCACGSPFSTIREIQGRVIEFFVLPDGTRVHPYEVFVPIRLCSPWIRRFQATQYAMDHVVFRVLPEGRPSEEQLLVVRAMFAEHFGPAVRFDLELVEGFGLSSSGKFQTYRCHVEAPSS